MVTLVVTLGFCAVDLCAQKLAQKVDVPEFYTDIYQRIRERCNISWLSIKAILGDWNFIRALSELGGIVHLPNQREALEVYKEVEEGLGV